MRGLIAVIAGCLLVGIWASWVFLRDTLQHFGYDVAYSDLGVWGDSFGPLNALFAALGFSAVFYTLLLQQRQTAAAERDQHKQRFESSFFELMRMLKDAGSKAYYFDPNSYALRSAIKIKSSHTGAEAFQGYWSDIKPGLLELEPNPGEQQAQKVYNARMRPAYASVVDPFYNLFTVIISRISNDNILTETDKNNYIEIVLSQFNSYETSFIALRSAGELSNDNFLFIKKYQMLRHIPETTYRGDFLRRLYGINPPNIKDDFTYEED